MTLAYMQKHLDTSGKIYPLAVLYAHRDGRNLKGTIRSAGMDVRWDDFFSSFEVFSNMPIARVDLHHDMHESTIYEPWHPMAQKLYSILAKNGFHPVITEGTN